MGGLLPVANVLGRLMMLFSLSYAVPMAGSLVYLDGMAADWAFGMFITLGLGAGLFLGTRRHYRELKVRDGFLLVTSSWVIMGAIAAVPLMLIYKDLGFTNALFETISAMTTTGGTVLVGLDNAPQSVNLWRHLLQWLGGLGIIVLAVAILPLLGVGGMQLYRAEMPGPMKEARIADTAKALYLFYTGATAACAVSLRVAGMSWFDAICHAFSTVSLGGFSTRDANIAAFDSLAIEVVMVAFMVVGALNFATHFLAWRGRERPCRPVPVVAGRRGEAKAVETELLEWGSMIASNSALPSNSEIITALYGSQLQILSPLEILSPSLTYRYAPYGMLFAMIILFVPGSTILNSPERPKTTSSGPSSVW